MTEMHEPIYRHRRPLASGVPLGGLGTGSVEIRDDGRFHDWEIFNNYAWSGNGETAPPEMWSEDAFFAVRVLQEGDTPRVRLLYHDDMKSRAACANYHHAIMYNFPFLRNVEHITYSGRPPFARLEYEDPALPLELSLSAFTPFIPFNAKDSGLPLACFVFRVKNAGRVPCETSLMFSMRNCAGYDLDGLTLRHRVKRDEEGALILMDGTDMDEAHRTRGSTALACAGDDVSYMHAWTDGRGLLGFRHPDAPALAHLFYPFRDEGELDGSAGEWIREIARKDMTPPPGSLHHARRQVGWRWRGALCRKVRLQPGEEAEVVFLLGWFFPNHYHYFARDVRLGHAYENRFSDAEEVARYGLENFDRLHGETRAFCENLYEGSLPHWLSASLAAQLTTFPQSFWWTKDGEIAAWEGSACCQIIPGTRTPWSSWQPLLFFPELAMEMTRRMARFSPEEESAQGEGVDFLTADRKRKCVSRRAKRGQFGGWYENRFRKYGYDREDITGPSVPPHRRSALSSEAMAVQVLRDYLWTGDEEYLREVWPLVRDTLEAHVEADENGDGLPDGLLSFITYDHWFLPATNCYKCTMWLAELRAGARMAELVGDKETADAFREVLERGAESFEKLFWNGEYYNLCYDPKQDRADEGCMADQVSGHLYLRLCGLRPVHDEERVRSALRSVHRHNRRPEEGLLNGADPRGREDWRYFARFSGLADDEALAGQWVTPWTGTEYYVSALMIAEGLVKEGLDVARDVYERHADAGMLYNHIECGEHYFRAMAAWAMLPALQGLTWDAAEGDLRVAPRLDAEEFDSIFILPGSWGRLRQARSEGAQTNEVDVESGEMTVSSFTVELPAAANTESGGHNLLLNGEEVASTGEPVGNRLTVRPAEKLELRAGDQLRLRVRGLPGCKA